MNNEKGGFRSKVPRLLGAVVAKATTTTPAFFRSLAFALLLACVAGRAFVAEVPFRVNPLKTVVAAGAVDGQGGAMSDRTEVARITFAMLLLASAGLWLLAGAAGGRLDIKYPALGLGVLAFALLSAISAAMAADKRNAWDTWLEQAALLVAGFVAMQLCRSRQRFLMLVVVLAALCATLGAKAIYQRAEEIPERIAFFQANRLQQLANLGVSPGSPGEKMLARRLQWTTVTGYFGLANLFAAELILLLAGGVALAGAKIAIARRALGSGSSARASRSGRFEISPAGLAWVLAAVGVVLGVAALVMTKSRGGIGAAACVVAVSVGLVAFGKRLAGRWRAVTLGIFAAIILGLAGVAAVGAATSRLPSKTLAVRWFYWTGSGELVAERPVFGVGGGNFPNEYLRVRRDEAQEEVKTPHNFIAHAACQFGLVGGGVYVGLLIAFILAAVRRVKTKTATAGGGCTTATAEGDCATVFWTFAAVVFSALFSRWIFELGGLDANIFLVILDGLVPAIFLAMMLGVSAWCLGLGGGERAELPDGVWKFMRLALAAGAVGFVIHNLVSYGLWAAGTATAFWITLGAAAGAGPGVTVSLRRSCWPLAGALLGAIVAVGICLAWPVYDRQAKTEQLVGALSRGDFARAKTAAISASLADPLDAMAKMNVARILLTSSPGPGRTGELLRALRWADLAMETNPRDPAAARLAGKIAGELARAKPDSAGETVTAGEYRELAVEYFARATVLDRANGRLKLDYAQALIAAGRVAKAREIIAQAQAIDRKLAEFDPDSASRFGPPEQRKINAMLGKDG